MAYRINITLCLLFLTLVNVQADDDTGRFYDPVERDIEGWTVAVDPKLLEEGNKEIADRAFQALANHLQRIKYIVPEERVAEMQKLRPSPSQP